MMRAKRTSYFGLAWMAVTALALVAAVPAVQGDETAGEGAAKVTPLGVRQQHVARMMEDLETKFKALAAELAKTEPERAAKIQKALEESKTLGVQGRMFAITKLLNDQQLDPAAGEQKQILADVRKLLELLLDDDSQDKFEEYERLEKWKRDLEDIIKDEKQQEKESDKIANKDDTLAKLAKQIAAVQELIKQQEEVINKTGEARAKGAQALGPVADAQRQVRKETEKVAGDIEGKPADEAGEGKEGSGKEGAGKEGAGKEGAGKEGAGKEGAGKEGAGKEGAGGEGGEGGEGSAGKEAQKPPASPSAQALEKAAQHQQRAESHLQEGKGKAAEAEEKQALEDLKTALKKLENEEDRIAMLPPEAFDQMAGKQDETANKTAKLEEEIKKESKAGGGEGGEGGEGGKGSEGGEGGEGGESQPKKPGQKQVQQAQQSMERASGDLRKKDPSEANKQQKKAIKELEKAIEEIEKRLAQLREETQLEKLARLEARFAEMLARQEATTRKTSEVEKKMKPVADLTRAEKLEIGKLAADERLLADMAQQAADIIIEDGTSVVFPQVVGQLQTDLLGVAQLLEQQRADAYTVSVQQEIEAALRELIDALKKAQEQKESSGGGGGGGGGGGEQPLLPNSAELKLLRSMQIRVNSRTASIDKARPKEGPLDNVLQKEIDGVAKRQQEISDLTQQIIERSQ